MYIDDGIFFPKQIAIMKSKSRSKSMFYVVKLLCEKAQSKKFGLYVNL